MGTRKVAAMAAGLLGLMGSIALTGCVPAGHRVLVIGDSLPVGAAAAGLGEEHASSWTVVAVKSLGTEAGVGLARQHAVGSFDLVVVALGTNDYLDDVASYRRRIERMMGVLGSSVPVIWINVDAGTPKLAPAAHGVNPALAAAAADHPSLRIADWNRYVAELDPAVRSDDQIHYTPHGYRARAAWMEVLVHGRRLPLPPPSPRADRVPA